MRKIIILATLICMLVFLCGCREAEDKSVDLPESRAIERMELQFINGCALSKVIKMNDEDEDAIPEKIRTAGENGKESVNDNPQRIRTSLSAFIPKSTRMTKMYISIKRTESREVSLRNIESFEDQIRRDLNVLKSYCERLKVNMDDEDHVLYYLYYLTASIVTFLFGKNEVSINPFYMTEHGISVSSIYSYVIYYGVILWSWEAFWEMAAFPSITY